MQNYKEINGNDYVKDSRTTINETMRSIQSMNSGTVFPTTNLFEGMKCYRTDLKKTYTLTDVENNTWVEDAHAALADEATHAASATKLQTPRALNLSGAVTADAASFDGTSDATINVKTLDASKLKGTASVSTTGNAATATKLATARTIALSGNATGSTTFDGSGNATINATVNESAHAASATTAASFVNGKAGGSWVSGMTQSNSLLQWTTPGVRDSSRYDPIMWGKDIEGNVWNLGWSAEGGIGFTGYKAGRTDNGTDGSMYFDPKTGITRGSFQGPLNGNATSATSWGTGTAVLVNDYQTVNDSDTWIPVIRDGKLQHTTKLDMKVGAAVNADSARLISPFEIGTANVFRNVWFSDSDMSNKACYNPNIQYNPATNVLKVGTVQGTATNSAAANKLAGESGSNYLEINTTTDNWNVLGSNPGAWLKSIRTNGSAPPYSIGNYSAAVAFGGSDTKGIITHAYDSPLVKFAGGNGSTAQWKFSIYGGRNDETYDLNNFPTKTGSGATGTWPISISGNADTVDGYHASDIINRITAANTGGIVAASLTANGYVKFANGLILQWGSSTGGDSWHHYTFPIAFSTVFDVIDGYSSTSTGQFYGYSKNITNTGFDMRIDSSKETGRYIAIGI